MEAARSRSKDPAQSSLARRWSQQVVLAGLLILAGCSLPQPASAFITPPPSAFLRQPVQPSTRVSDVMPLRLAPLDVVDKFAKEARRKDSFELVGTNKEMETAVQAMIANNPTESPGEWSDAGKAARLAEGRWEVLYAPHIGTLQKLGLTEFGPIRYNLASEGDKRVIVSNVRYQSPLFGNGWLNAAGTYISLDSNTVRIVFEEFWWDIATENPSDPPSVSGVVEGVLPGLVQGLGSAGFIPAFSTFPVQYVDENTCIFEFQLSGTSILARKVSQ